MDNKKPVQVSIEKELHMCTQCGYEDGFPYLICTTVQKNQCNIILICPSCHARFDPDWTVEV